jgi:hypothetical protein
MVAMLMDLHHKISTFICPLPFEVDAVPKPKLNDGIDVISSTFSHIIGVWGLGIMGGVKAQSITFCEFIHIWGSKKECLIKKGL